MASGVISHTWSEGLPTTSVSAAASSLESLLCRGGAADAPAVFKAIHEEDGRTYVACDPLDICGAVADEGDAAFCLLKEALDGLNEVHIGSLDQARLVVLTSTLLSEVQTLRNLGLTQWAVALALRTSVQYSVEALEQLASQRLAEELLKKLSQASAPGTVDLGGITLHTDVLPGGRDSDSGDDLDWFFSQEAKAPGDSGRNSDGLDRLSDAEISSPQQAASASEQGAGHSGATLEEILSGFRKLLKADDETLHRHVQVQEAPAAADSMHDAHPLFIYAALRPRLKPRMDLCAGVVCHVPRRHLVSPLSKVAMSDFIVTGTAFLDADLLASTYESIAPAERRLHERLTVESNYDPTDLARPLPKLPSQIKREKELRLAEVVSSRLEEAAVSALFLSGEVADVIAEACKAKGILVVTELHGQLLRAVAAEASAEVFYGLPPAAVISKSAGKSTPLRCRLSELSSEQRKGCFLSGLPGAKQQLLPHERGVGEDAEGPCWQLHISNAESRIVTCATVTVEASCEPTLRLLHMDICDGLHRQRRQDSEAQPQAGESLGTAGAWADAIADKLELEAQALAVSNGQRSQEVQSREGRARWHLASPWVARSDDGLATAAVFAGLSRAYRRMSSLEAASSEARAALREDDEQQGSGQAENRDSLFAVRSVVRQSLRIVELIANTDELQPQHS